MTIFLVTLPKCPPPKNQANAKKRVSDLTGVLPPPKKTYHPRTSLLPAKLATFALAGKGGSSSGGSSPALGCVVLLVEVLLEVALFAFCLLKAPVQCTASTTLRSRPAWSTPKLLLLRTSLERVTEGHPLSELARGSLQLNLLSVGGRRKMGQAFSANTQGWHLFVSLL